MTKQKRTPIREICMLPVNDSGSGIKLSHTLVNAVFSVW